MAEKVNINPSLQNVASGEEQKQSRRGYTVAPLLSLREREKFSPGRGNKGMEECYANAVMLLLCFYWRLFRLSSFFYLTFYTSLKRMEALKQKYENISDQNKLGQGEYGNIPGDYLTE